MNNSDFNPLMKKNQEWIGFANKKIVSCID